ncbi:MAG: NADH-quinone oxidoreductase subunit C [Vampirovibrionales bacterium]
MMMLSSDTTQPAHTTSTPEVPEVEPLPLGPVAQVLHTAGVTSVVALGDDAKGVEMLQVASQDALKAAQILKETCGFDLALSCTGMDWKTHREAVYHFYSLQTHGYVVLKLQADEADQVASLTPVYPALNWHERETYDLLGIHFEGHPDLRRILMPADWVGYPLRKDYKENDPRLVWNQR